MPADPFASPRCSSGLRPMGTPGSPLGTDELGRDLLSRLMLRRAAVAVHGHRAGDMAFVIGSAAGHPRGLRWRARSTRSSCGASTCSTPFPSVLLAIALSGSAGRGHRQRADLADGGVRTADRAHRRERDHAGAQRATTSMRPAPQRRLRLHHRRAPMCWATCSGPMFVYAASLVVGVDHPGLGPVLPRPRREAAAARVGPDAQHAAHRHLRASRWIAALPGVLIFVTSISFNLLADGLRTAMDVKQ